MSRESVTHLLVRTPVYVGLAWLVGLVPMCVGPLVGWSGVVGWRGRM